jgi:hypothetical protein
MAAPTGLAPPKYRRRTVSFDDDHRRRVCRIGFAEEAAVEQLHTRSFEITWTEGLQSWPVKILRNDVQRASGRDERSDRVLNADQDAGIRKAGRCDARHRAHLAENGFNRLGLACG